MYSMVVHTTVPFGLDNINCNIDSICYNVVLSRLRQLLPQLPASLSVEPYRWQYSQVFCGHFFITVFLTLWFCYFYSFIIIIIFGISSLFALPYLHLCNKCNKNKLQQQEIVLFWGYYNQYCSHKTSASSDKYNTLYQTFIPFLALFGTYYTWGLPAILWEKW